MIRKIAIVMALCGVIATWGAIPEGYYSAMEGKKKAELKAAAKSAASKHTEISYGTETWEAFEKTDTRMVGGALCWWDMYSNNNVKVANGHPGMNIEHSVANSWWGGTKNAAYKDLFHLNPSNSEANNRKNNFPLGIVETESYNNGITIVGKPANGTCGGAKNVYEPADMYKGDFARVFFYMFTIYDDISWETTLSDRNYMFDGSAYPSLRPWAYQMLLEWAANDPVDQKEIDRNEAIYGIQHNRNPFIDYPQLAEYIWGSKTGEAFYAADQEGYVPGPGPGPDPKPDPDPIDPPYHDYNTKWVRVTNAGMLAAGSEYIIVSTKDNVAMGYDLVNNKAISRAEDVVYPDEDGVIDEIGTDVGIIRLEPLSDGKYKMAVYDYSGSMKGYLTSTTSKNATLGDTGSAVSISPRSDQTVLSFGDAGNLQYNASSPRFCTYTTVQQTVYLYRAANSTEIEMRRESAEEEIWFDLTGRSVKKENLSPGIYIKAGRKIMVPRY